MENFRCSEHDRPMNYLCTKQSCSHTGPICSHRGCLSKHTHQMELNIVQIGPCVKEIKERRESQRGRVQKAQNSLKTYYSLFEQELMSLFKKKQSETVLVEKTFMQSNDLKPQIKQTIEALKTQKYQSVKKASLRELLAILNAPIDKEARSKQINLLQTQLNNRFQKVDTLCKQFLNSQEVRKLIKINIFNPKQVIKHARFDAQTSSWTFQPRKIDAIQFQLTEPVRLIGFTHFAVVDWTRGALLTMRVVLYKQERSPLLSMQVRWQKEHHENRDIQVNFNRFIDLQPGVKYNIYTQNIGVGFSGKHGSTAKEKSGPFRFSKSSKDTNGTSATGGQFKNFRVYAHY